MIRLVHCLLFLAMLASAHAEEKIISILPYHGGDFNVAGTKAFTLNVQLKRSGLLNMYIMSPDGDIVRHLIKNKSIESGVHPFNWDGKDDEGQLVADEAYIPKVTLKHNDQEIVFDPKTFSGGEAIQKIPVEIQGRHKIKFELENPARILARVGVKSGPMLNGLISWQPRPAGTNVIHWSGQDVNQVASITEHPGFSVMVTGYQLPKHAIITRGNKAYTYKAYIKGRKPHLFNKKAKSKRVAERNGAALSRFFFEPKYKPMDPAITVSFTDVTLDEETKLPILNKNAKINVNIPKEERWAIESSLYEVGFFIDYEFISEEEQGYVPFVWQLDPAFLTSGRHILTVNISGFNGQVGVASADFIVKKRTKK